MLVWLLQNSKFSFEEDIFVEHTQVYWQEMRDFYLEPNQFFSVMVGT